MDQSAKTAYFELLHKIKAYYELNIERILEHHQMRPHSLYDSYAFDWGYVLNEIEFIIWGITKEKGCLPFYPQFPVLHYFLDFAHPALKIGIEVDGIEFHDQEKDRERDTKLKNEGWTIIRIPAAQVMRTNFKYEWNDFDYIQYFGDADEESIKNITDWIMNTGDGVMEAIKVTYFKGNTYCPESYDDWYRELCARSLKSHTLI